MQIVREIFLLSCLLLLGYSIEVSAAGLDLAKASDCAEVVVEGATVVAGKLIPLLKDSAKCCGFTLQKTKDLDVQYLVLLAYSFLQKFTANQKCMTDVLEKTGSWVQPYVKKTTDMKCLNF